MITLDDGYRESASDEIAYTLSARDGDGEWMFLHTETIGVGVAPAAATLAAPHPNPFNPRTTITLTLDRDQPLRLTIFDAAGRRVRTLHDGPCTAGTHSIEWNGRDEGGRPLASGVYLVRMATAEARDTRRLVLLR
ncbi:MAG: T9SS type A sorting domain-containing protein [Phycisphaeraceae bacterium]|nr:T9SS type A sorting domain-containing protein [Phycisphaeraceae bacterium]